MRFYPTDLLLAVEHAEASLRTDPASALGHLLAESGWSELSALFDSTALAAALDEALGGLSQFPWRPMTDTDDVWRHDPAGRVALDDDAAGPTLRGLLLAWALGNDVVLRTARPEPWEALIALLREAGVPLPGARTAPLDTPVDGARHVRVPDLVVEGDGPAVDGELFVRAPRPGSAAIRIQGAPGLDGLPSPVAALDCRSPWFQELFTATYLAGTTLARARDDDPQRAARLDARLRYLVGRARRTPHYRDLPRVTGTADLVRLPILDKHTLEKVSLPRDRGLSSGALPSGEVLRSGASSGEPRYIVYSRTDWENMVREAIPLMRSLGVRNGDRVVNTLMGGGLYGGLITTSSELTRMPVEAYSAGQQITADLLLMLVRDFSANVLLGMPALILPLLREAKQLDPALRIEKVVYGGTPMTESDKQWLRTELGTEVISSILAANDGAQLGHQCAHMGRTLHHINDDYNLIEVVDDDGRPVPDGQSGHLLITSMQKFEGPLIRYRIGDVGHVSQRDCACGGSGRVLEYLGRSDGQIKVKAWTVHYGELLDALEKFQISQLQAEIQTCDGTETLIVRTEAPHELDPDTLHAFLTGALPVLSHLQAFDDGLKVFELRVECHPEGSLDRNPVSGKIKTVIDRRLD
ncbi:phenylacetate--CoA ligase family protein [Streptomyces hundungensis]|uniref:phenylacetate--CoA ligase family protein n=1 Tax=Streptomyces hundungensis TaxID=1077946 RepID=UPI0033FF7035